MAPRYQQTAVPKHFFTRNERQFCLAVIYKFLAGQEWVIDAWVEYFEE